MKQVSCEVTDKAWRNYVDEKLPELRKEFPHFKRGKLLYMLREEWQKAA